MRWTSHLIACCSFILLCSLASPARAEPKLSHSLPAAVEPGKTTQVVLHGDRLTDPLRVWTSFPARVEILAVEAKLATLSITVPSDVSVGPGGLFVATGEGPSEPIVFLVDDLPSIDGSGSNHSPADAQELPPLCGVDGVSGGARSSYFRFQAEAGQRVAFDVLGQRLHSTFDPVLRLLDADGRELLYADDDPAWGPDCRFSYTFAAAGAYLLELRDSKYSSGGRYRLRIGDFPLVNSTLPLSGRAGEVREVGFAGPDCPADLRVELAVPNEPGLSEIHVGARLPGGQSSAWAALRVSDVPQLVEVEPNDEPTQAMKITLPCGVSGRLDSPGDRDYFEIDGVKGETARFSASTRSLGSPTFLVMRLYNAAGAKVAETPVNDTDEWAFDYKFPEDGIYRLMVEDLLRRGGPEHSYHASITRGGSFALTIKNDKATRDRFVIEQAQGACALDLQVQRLGYNGAIVLSLADDPPGLRIVNPTIPPGAKEARILIAADDEWNADRVVAGRIIGRAADDPDQVAVVGSDDLLRGRSPHVPYPPTWRDGWVGLAGVAASEPFFGIKLPDQPVVLARPLGEAQVSLTLERHQADFKEDVTILADQLPDGFTTAVKPEKDVYQVTLQGPADQASDSLTVRLLAFGDFKQRGRIEAIDLPIQPIDPLTIVIEPAGPIVAGQSQKVTLKLSRQGDDPQPVTVAWSQLPAGVSGDETISIAADQQQVEVELRAAADAAATDFEQLTVEAASKYAGKDFKIVSQPARLEVKGE